MVNRCSTGQSAPALVGGSSARKRRQSLGGANSSEAAGLLGSAWQMTHDEWQSDGISAVLAVCQLHLPCCLQEGDVFRTIRAMNRASESCRCGQSWSVPAVVDPSRGWGKGSRRNSGCEPRKAVITSRVSITVTVATE